MNTKDALEHAIQEAFNALDTVEAAAEEREADLLARLANGPDDPASSIRLEPAESGILRADFKDENGCECSIQESGGRVRGAYLWLGRNNASEYSRMYLSRETAAELIPLLVRFVRTGGLRDEEGETGEA